MAAFCGHSRKPMQMWPFLRAHLEHPRLEHLVKVGFFSLAADLAYRNDYNRALDESQRRTHRILQVEAEDVPFLRGLDPDMGTLEVFHGYAGLKDRQRLLRWQMDNQVTRDVDQILEHMTAHKFMRYMDKQFAVLRADGGRGRYLNMQSAVSEYRDYLGIIAQLGYNMGNSFALYPKDLQKAHDRVQGRVKAKADAQMRRDFKEAMRAIFGRLDFEADGMKFLLPTGPEDLAAEGNALHHCVGSYADRVARKECVILFLRRCEDVSKPLYTVEIRNLKIIQVRGRGNCDPTPEVEAFMSQWERQVLRAPAAA